ncbi:MAG TPA: DUF3352 domain-containing protein, partial [Thermomicrobiales bacterium]|nr:DUF3352 domain-containing protein [Thermomicrobiales bacterium]
MPEYAAPTNLQRRSLSIALVMLLALSFFATSMSLGGSARAAQTSTLKDTTAALTPASALAYVDINLDQNSDQWHLSTDLLKRAGLDDVLSEGNVTSTETETADSFLGGSAALVLTKLPATGDVSLDSLTGEVTGAATDPASLTQSTIPSGFSVIFQSPDLASVEAQLKETLGDNADSDGSTVKTETYEGVVISSLTPTDPTATGTAYAVVKDSLVVATVAGDIKPIIDAATGKVATLADDTSYKTLKGDLNSDSLAFGLVNGTALLAQAKKQDPTVYADLDPTQVAQFDGTVGFVLWADQPGFRIDTLTLANPDATAAKAPAPLDGDFASKVPADSLFFANGTNINQFGILDSLGLVFAQALVGTGEEGIDGTPTAATPVSATEQAAQIYEQAAALLGFNIKTDFIDQLTGEFGVAVSASDLTSETPNISAIFATDVNDSQKVTDVASKISFILSSALGSTGLSSRDVKGSSITSIDLSGDTSTPEAGTPDASSDASSPLKIEYGVVDGQLLIGVNDGIDDYVNGPTDSLADSKVYKDTLAQLPQNPTGIVFVNVQEILPLLDEAASDLAVTATSVTVRDASPDCAKYDTQQEAQDAYDADSFTNFDLDEDLDGQACED